MVLAWIAVHAATPLLTSGKTCLILAFDAAHPSPHGQTTASMSARAATSRIQTQLSPASTIMKSVNGAGVNRP